MADSHDTDSRDSSRCDAHIAAVLQAIADTLLDGTVPEEYFRPACAATREQMERLLADILAIRKFAIALSNGDLSQELAVKGHLPGGLKALQSNLRHLTWQTRQVASGDLTQRVHFMGEFSVSFNEMVEQLARERKERTDREEELRKANVKLAYEIAEEQRYEKALNITNRKLGLLTSITRHDIKNQLTVILGYLDLLKDMVTDPEIASYLAKQEKAAQSILRQIEFTRNYGDLGIQAPCWQKISSVLDAAAGSLHMGTVTLENHAGSLDVYADPLFPKVFYNLIDNALRYGGENLTKIMVSTKENKEGIIITVEDDGAGISAEDKKRLFEKGFGKNTGYGLHLSREILSLTGISIVEDSLPGNGARFRITVPKDMYRFQKG